MSAAMDILVQQLHQADAVLLGIGSGLSSAAGYNHYHWTPAMARDLEPFRRRYGFASPFAGFYHCFGSYEEQWGYYSQYIRCMQQAPTTQPYRDLAALVADKPHFVLTTNIDGQAGRVFAPENTCLYQGDFSFFQCSQPCHDEIYPNQDMINAMTAALDTELKIPTELVPRCKECGRVMVPWVRDDTFLQGKKWQAGVERYRNFLRRWLVEKPDTRLLLMEVGVGEMTPSIIKLPFWALTENNPNVFYACLNREQTDVPVHLRPRALYVQGDLKDTLAAVRERIDPAESETERNGNHV